MCLVASKRHDWSLLVHRRPSLLPLRQPWPRHRPRRRLRRRHQAEQSQDQATYSAWCMWSLTSRCVLRGLARCSSCVPPRRAGCIAELTQKRCAVWNFQRTSRCMGRRTTQRCAFCCRTLVSMPPACCACVWCRRFTAAVPLLECCAPPFL